MALWSGFSHRQTEEESILIIRDWSVGMIFSGAVLVVSMRSLFGTSSNIFRSALCEAEVR